MNLPAEFTKALQEILGEEYSEYLDSFERKKVQGLRVNTLKISVEEFERIAPFHLTRVPWTSNGFFYEEGDQPSKHPYYYAGLYYLQEPSAMIPASQLPIVPGDKVLDLCAAPGGKATELGAKLEGQGLLVANDISNSRAKGLLKNLELFGIANGLVVSEEPKRLLRYFEEYFDKILIDAPCSGEGMFRKDPSMVKSWIEQGPMVYQAVQKDIVIQASKMLKPGGLLLYSTCTFSYEENEKVVKYLLEQVPEFQMFPPVFHEGFSKGRPDLIDGTESLKNCIRIWPHKIKGEGHFIALLKKSGEGRDTMIKKEKKQKTAKIPEEITAFFKDIYQGNLLESIKERGVDVRDERVYFLPEGLNSIKGLRFLRTGLYLGILKKGRFEPSQALAMSLSPNEYSNCIRLEREDNRVLKYLKGETIDIDDFKINTQGWYLVCIEKYPLGWAKIVQGGFRNKYYAGWRWQ
jgi:NOL1/NOP2/sun family putative RNA methylase